jgi:hypothetical protein
MTLAFQHPCTIIVSGPSGSGKSELTKQIILNKNAMFHHPPERVIWCYSESTALCTELDDVEFHEGLFNLDSLDISKRTLIIYDDMVNNEEANKHMLEVSVKKSHHMNLSAFWITQNMFAPNKHNRTISINASYMILMKSPRDRLQISYLSRQVYPHKSKFVLESYNDATSNPHGYLLIDFKQSTPEKFRFRTNILPNEDTIVYVPK